MSCSKKYFFTKISSEPANAAKKNSLLYLIIFSLLSDKNLLNLNFIILKIRKIIMEQALSFISQKENIKQTVIDILGLSFIYFIPALSHMFAVPLYYLEPTRIVLILALVHTSKKNAYLLALTIPLFSFVISSHPAMIKSFLIGAELILNVYLFYALNKYVKSLFPAAILSILLSKAAYYALKALFLNVGYMSGDLISTPILIQLILMLVFSAYIYLFFNKTEK